jgi:CcmD family protein
VSWAGQVIAAYVAVFGGLAAYAASVIVRGRKLSRELPPEERRWM